jgi:hypothetical protein
MYQDTFNTIIISFSFIFVMIQWMFALSKTDTFGAHLLLSHVSKALPSEHKTQSSREEEVKTFKCYVRLSLLYNACKINMELGRGALRSGLNECPNKRLFKVIGWDYSFIQCVVHTWDLSTSSIYHVTNQWSHLLNRWDGEVLGLAWGWFQTFQVEECSCLFNEGSSELPTSLKPRLMHRNETHTGLMVWEHFGGDERLAKVSLFTLYLSAHLNQT